MVIEGIGNIKEKIGEVFLAERKKSSFRKVGSGICYLCLYSLSCFIRQSPVIYFSAYLTRSLLQVPDLGSRSVGNSVFSTSFLQTSLLRTNYQV